MPKIDQNDPRLTAYALDEMPAAERAEFEKHLSDDPAARDAIAEIRRTAGALADALAAEPLPERSISYPLAPHQSHWLRQLWAESWTIWVPLGAAAVFAVFFWRVYLPAQQRQHELASRGTAVPSHPSGVPIEVAFTESDSSAAQPAASKPRTDSPETPTGIETASTTLKTAYFLTARQNPTSRFAVNVGSAAYADVRRSLEAGERPSTGMVRIEELVNSFRYSYPQPSGDASLALSTEMHAAPWADGHLLVRIGLQGRAASVSDPTPAAARDAAREHLTASAARDIRALAARDVKVQVDFNPEKVLAYRLIGYENRLLKGVAEAATNDDLAAGRSVTALYEIVPLPPLPRSAVAAKTPPPPTPDPSDTAEWLTVKLRYSEPGVAQGRSVIVPLHANVAAETPTPSADFKFAAAVAGFGLILQDNPNRGTATWDMVEELAKAGIATEDTTASEQRRDFVSLVKKAREIEPAETPAATGKPAAQ